MKVISNCEEDTGKGLKFETNGGTIAMTIDTNQDVAIGGAQDGYKLSLEEGDQHLLRLKNTKATGVGSIAFENSTALLSRLQFQNNGGIRFQTYDGSAYDELFRIGGNGNVGIGTDSPVNKLEVNGTIRYKEVKVEVNNWPDYVFEPNYELRTLEETEEYIEENKHLPEIPSAKEIEANGVELGEMNRLLLMKIEELTLHQIELLKEVQLLKEENRGQQKEIDRLKRN